MASPMDEMADMVFKRIEGTDQALDTRMFNVLAAIDGVRTVGAIARDNHYEIKDLSEVVEQLKNKGVIEPVLTKESQISRNVFLNDLEKRLNQFMGPVTSLVIQDCVTQMGCDQSSFPMGKAHELVTEVSRSIPNREDADAFVRSMNAMLDGGG